MATCSTRKSGALFHPLSCVYSLRSERRALSKKFISAESPSGAIKSPVCVETAVSAPSGPPYGRPVDRFGAPTVLFSPELALLEHDLDHLEGIIPDSVTASRASDLIYSSTTFSDEEGKRETSLWYTPAGLLMGGTKWQSLITGGQTKLDGVWLEDFFAYLIVEMKTNQGYTETHLYRV